MKPDRIWFGIVFLVWLSGVGVWIASDQPGVPATSVWIWIGAVGLASVPFLLSFLDVLIGKLKRRRD